MSEEGEKGEKKERTVSYSIEMVESGSPVPTRRPHFVCGGFRMELPDGLVSLMAKVKEHPPSALQPVIEAHGLTASYDVDPEWTYRVVGSFIQLGWYEHYRDGVPQAVLDSHDMRLGDYRKAVKDSAAEAGTKAAERAANPKAPRAHQPASKYGLTDEAAKAMKDKASSEDWGKLGEANRKLIASAKSGAKGAAAEMVRALAEGDADIGSLTKRLVDSGATKSPKPETIARWYINDLKKRDVVQNV